MFQIYSFIKKLYITRILIVTFIISVIILIYNLTSYTHVYDNIYTASVNIFKTNNFIWPLSNNEEMKYAAWKKLMSKPSDKLFSLCDTYDDTQWKRFNTENSQLNSNWRNGPLFKQPTNITFDKTGHISLESQNLIVDMLKQEGIIIDSGGVHSLSADEKCLARERLAILVPYKDRTENLVNFLIYMHRFLSFQRREYQIFILEEDNFLRFNRAKLFNAGMHSLGLNSTEKDSYVMHDYECLSLHDIDKVPMNIEFSYSCKDYPLQGLRRLVKQEKENFEINNYYVGFMGGVTFLNRWIAIQMNGGSNAFRGWGGEDDDMYKRTKLIGYTLHEPDPNLASYISFNHDDKPNLNDDRLKMLADDSVKDRFLHDGFKQTEFRVTKRIKFPLYTLFGYDL